MSNVWFTSDLHWGHENIYKHRLAIRSEEHNRERIKDEWSSLVGPRDTVFLLGDVCFHPRHLPELASLRGNKVLIRGNHDTVDIRSLLAVFQDVWGLLRYKEFWLSHAPVHPNELRKKVNLHGHVHDATVDDPRYFNCCVENLWKHYGKALVDVDTIRSELRKRETVNSESH